MASFLSIFRPLPQSKMPRRLTACEIYDRLAAKGMATGVRPPDNTDRKRRRQEESLMQRKVVQWWDMTCKARWGLDHRLLFAVPNAGWRSPATAAIMKAEGLRAGVPDLLLAVPRHRQVAHANSMMSQYSTEFCSGIFLELKTPEGRVARNQETYHALLRAQGYRVEVVRSFDQAVEVISNYLDGK